MFNFVEKHADMSQRVLFLFGAKTEGCVWSLFFQTCDIKAEGRKRFLTLKQVQLDQAGEVSYQALNAVTSAMLTVKGTNLSRTEPTLFCVVCWGLLHLWASGFARVTVRKVSSVFMLFVNNC